MNQTIQNQIFTAQQAHINGFYEQAISLYSQILNVQTNFNILINRTKAYIDVHNISMALKDCDQIIKGSPTKYHGYFYQGICEFYQGAFEQSIAHLNEALKKLDGEGDQELKHAVQKQIQFWVNKISFEQNDNKLFKPLVVVAQNGTEEESKQQQSNNIQQQQQQQQQQLLIYQQVMSLGGKLKYSWAQDSTSVFVKLNQKVENEKEIKAQFQTKSLEITFPLTGSSNYEFNLDLLGEILPQQSFVKGQSDHVQIVLKKKNQNDHWLSLEVQSDLD